MPLPSWISPNATVTFFQKNSTPGVGSRRGTTRTPVSVSSWLKQYGAPNPPPHLKPKGVELTGNWLIGAVANGEVFPDFVKNGDEVVIEFTDADMRMTGYYVQRILGSRDELEEKLSNPATVAEHSTATVIG